MEKKEIPMYAGSFCRMPEREQPVTVVMSRAMEYASKKGHKVMVALLDCNRGTMTKEDRLHTFTDIESKKLREVIYKEIEDEA